MNIVRKLASLTSLTSLRRYHANVLADMSQLTPMAIQLFLYISHILINLHKMKHLTEEGIQSDFMVNLF